ncbi:HNH endonuclease [Rhizobium halophytocola]|uniref:5-methylcytosine-specific restriction protein A n=1 Tax=Rhizobium halophytocola TaxID=735519 RepID=A0ABS4DXW3_9HYPH|nr:HNH endonuclease signature motif containing protein [Rhizobium halophytocola]MBP1850525.1 5-methylcytosine-specific restriction protein A [Rhizobium halophytocola]
MSWGFERGKIYNRVADINARFSSTPQGGIIRPSRHNLVIAITGPGGHSYGYQDRENEDGTFDYFGAGRMGDMELVRGNKAIVEHSADSRSLLLFQEVGRRKGLRFKGEYVLESYTWQMAPDETGAMRRAVVFKLRPLENIVETVLNDEEPLKLSDEELLARARDAGQPMAPGTTTISNTYLRSKHVREWVLRRAAGHCEADGAPAPFLRANGEPYLEPHHILRVSDGGPDDIHHVIALCPNCHRRAHSGADAKAFNANLLQQMATIQPD